LREHFSSQVFDTVIPRNTRLCEARATVLPSAFTTFRRRGPALLIASEGDHEKGGIHESKASSR
jgi:hypothetical protein